MTVRPFLVNGEWRTGEGTFEVKSPFDDGVVAEIAVPTADDVEEAAAAAHETFKESRHLPVSPCHPGRRTYQASSGRSHGFAACPGCAS